MNSLDPGTLDRARAMTQEIVRRAQADADYKERVRADPAGVLRESGLPEEAIPAFVAEAGLDGGEVTGYSQFQLTVIDTCFCPTEPM